VPRLNLPVVMGEKREILLIWEGARELTFAARDGEAAECKN
jgi:hypothetical protein